MSTSSQHLDERSKYLGWTDVKDACLKNVTEVMLGYVLRKAVGCMKQDLRVKGVGNSGTRLVVEMSRYGQKVLVFATGH